MRQTLSLYGHYVAASIRAQMQYRASFIMDTIGMIFRIGLEFVGVWALFDRFGTIIGWTLPEIALYYGMINMSFAISEAAARGFDNFDSMVRHGEFDRMMLRPQGTALQVAGSEFQIRRVGRFAQGLFILLWAAFALDVIWTIPKVLLLIGAVCCGACLFCGVFVLQATLSFWWITAGTLEVVNAVTYGGVETAQYPLSVYRPWFRAIFIFVIPLAAVNYFPGLAILSKADPLGMPAWFQWVSPLIGVVFMLVSLRIWRYGERHYHSTGS